MLFYLLKLFRLAIYIISYENFEKFKFLVIFKTWSNFRVLHTIPVIGPLGGRNLSMPIFSLPKVSQYIRLESLPLSIKILVTRIVSRTPLTTRGTY
jgi:hypothetical protein